MLCHLLIAFLIAVPATARTTAVTADPPADTAHPAGLTDFVLDSHGSAINAVIYTASGAGPHPALLLLHGFPGNEQNLDLAQAARRAGWHVVTIHYRGSWGSHGDFSFTHCIEDAQAALDWLRAPANVAKYGIDPHRIAVAGHSMGGFVAVETAAANSDLAGVALIDAWNIGHDAAKMTQEGGRAAVVAKLVPNLAPLAGTSAGALADEAQAQARAWELTGSAAALARQPLFVVGASRGIGAGNAALAAAVEARPGAHVTALTMPTDHSFSDHRIALATALVDWLETLK